MSEITPLDLGSPVSPTPPGPSSHSANSINLAHKLAVRIACHMLRNQKPEAKAFLEVDTCIKVLGSIPTIETSDDGLERQLSTFHNWERALISDWMLEYWWSRDLVQEALQHPEGKVPAPQYVMQLSNPGAIVPLPDASSGK